MLLGGLLAVHRTKSCRTKNYLASNIGRAVVEKLCVSDFVCVCVCVARSCI